MCDVNVRALVEPDARLPAANARAPSRPHRERRLERRVPADPLSRRLRRDEVVRAVVHRGARR
jgi:hypothetical protein